MFGLYRVFDRNRIMCYLKSLFKMKKLFTFVMSAMILASCASSKRAVVSEVSRSATTSLEGEKVNVETMKVQGIEMSESLSDDGTEMVSRPYKWYAGIGQADNKQMAIELAQREAYATISRVLNNAVYDESERGNVANNGRVQQALTSHWQQVSTSLQKGCEPFGDVRIEYNPTTRMYNATAKVAIRGDRFNKLLNTAGSFKPDNLSGDELEQFIEVNKSIMEAAKGN